MNSAEHLARLDGILDSIRPIAVAFSGGVDSTFLAHRCAKVHGAACRAVIVDSPFLPRSELGEACRIAEELGIKVVVVTIENIGGDILDNTKDRCYLCKTTIITAIRRVIAREAVIVEGSNVDDLGDYRPGMRALKELGVRSPLLEAGFTKKEIRIHAGNLGLSNWNKPAASCLATRIGEGERIDFDILSRIEKAEEFLKQEGIRACRVRLHGPVARIEVPPEDRPVFFDITRMDLVARKMKELGFTYVSLDLEGYRRGSMNSSTVSKGEIS